MRIRQEQFPSRTGAMLRAVQISLEEKRRVCVLESPAYAPNESVWWVVDGQGDWSLNNGERLIWDSSQADWIGWGQS